MIPYTTIPFVSAFFLMLVGFLISQIFWVRRREDHEYQATQLFEKYSRLKAKFAEQSADYDRVETQRKQETTELESLRGELDELRDQARAWQRESESVAAQLSDERKARQDLETCLGEDRAELQQLRTELKSRDAKLHELKLVNDSRLEERAQLEQQLEEAFKRQSEQSRTAQQLRSEADALQTQLENSQQTVDRLTSQHTQLLTQRNQLLEQRDRQSDQNQSVSDQLAILTKQLAAAQAECQASGQQRDEAEARVESLSAEVSDLQDSRSRWEHDSDVLHAELAEAARLRNEMAKELKSAEHQIDSLNQRLLEESDSAERQLRLLNEQRHVAQEAADRQMAELNEQLVYGERQRQALTKQIESAHEELAGRDAALTEVRDHVMELEEARTVLAHVYQESKSRELDLSRQLEAMGEAAKLETHRWQRELEQVREEFELSLSASTQRLQEVTSQSEDSNQQLQREQRRLESSLAEAQQQIERLTVDLERLERVDDEIVQRNAELGRIQRELEIAEKQRDQALEVESAMKSVVHGLREELNDRLTSVDALGLEKDSMDAQLSAERRRSESLQLQVDALENARRQVAESLEELQREHDDLKDTHRDLLDQLHRTERELERWRSVSHEYEQRLANAEARAAELSEQLDTEQQMARQTRKRRFGVLGNVGRPDPNASFSFRELKSRQEAMREDDRAYSRLDSILGTVYDRPPSIQDDLTRLPGVDLQVARQLNDLGIYTFGQVMVWDEQATQAVAQQLPHELPVQDWVSRARHLYHGEDRNAA